MNKHTSQVLYYQHWLSPNGISCALSRWVVDLIPKHIELANNKVPFISILKAAAICGSQMAAKVDIGQVSYYKPATHKIVIVHFDKLKEAQMISKFGKDCWMTSPASIVRTAIMMGLQLPLINEGVISPTRWKPLTRMEVSGLLARAKELVKWTLN